MNSDKDEQFNIAVHEAGHHVVADHFEISSWPELTPDGRSARYPTQTFNNPGVCHLEQRENGLKPFALATLSWAGMIGQAMYASAPFDFPKFKPTKKLIRDWYSMVMHIFQETKSVSTEDKTLIRAYPNTWRSCKKAFDILREAGKPRVVGLAKALIKAQQKEDEQKKWAGVPRPKSFPAKHDDFLQLVCGGDAEKFEAFIIHRAALHLTNGTTGDIAEAKEMLGKAFDAACEMSMNLQRSIYASEFPNDLAWLRAAKDFRDFEQWQARQSREEKPAS